MTLLRRLPPVLRALLAQAVAFAMLVALARLGLRFTPLIWVLLHAVLAVFLSRGLDLSTRWVFMQAALPLLVRALWGAPPIAEALDLYLAMLDGSGLRWAVAVVGGSLFDGPVLDAALSRGGHVRVGLEDDPTGPTNAEQVRRVVERIEAAGRRVATPAETAEFLW